MIRVALPFVSLTKISHKHKTRQRKTADAQEGERPVRFEVPSKPLRLGISHIPSSQSVMLLTDR